MSLDASDVRREARAHEAYAMQGTSLLSLVENVVAAAVFNGTTGQISHDIFLFTVIDFELLTREG